jgi:hypothetical protein
MFGGGDLKPAPALPAMLKPAPTLPAMLKVALDAGGMDGALGLARGLGGQFLYIPKKPPADHHPLVKAAGRKAADAIVRAFGGERCEIPTIRSLRRPLAIALLAEGTRSVNEIVEISGLSHRDVRRMRNYIKLGVAPGAMTERRVKQRRVESMSVCARHFLKV